MGGNKSIPLCIPYIKKEELDVTTEILRSGWLAHGDKNKEFEEEFAHYIGTKEAVSLNSCTSALFLAILAQNINGEVILPSFTFVASANSIVTAGAKPVFAEVDPDTFNMDPEKLEEKITSKTQAIMPVHYAGQTCNMKAIMHIAKKYGLKVIEDSAETIGGKFQGKKAGSFATGCFSFFPTKNITTGEGGMITTNDSDLIKKIRALSSHGIVSTTMERSARKIPWIRDAFFAGYNFRMPHLSAAIGLEQIKKVDKMNALRRKHAHYLNTRLSEFEEIQPPVEAKNCLHVYQMYVIKLLDKRIKRDFFVSTLREQGIGASVHFCPPVHLQSFYRKRYRYKKGTLPITESLSSSVVTLPMYPQLTEDNLDRIVSSVKKALVISRK